MLRFPAHSQHSPPSGKRSVIMVISGVFRRVGFLVDFLDSLVHCCGFRCTALGTTSSYRISWKLAEAGCCEFLLHRGRDTAKTEFASHVRDSLTFDVYFYCVLS